MFNVLDGTLVCAFLCGINGVCKTDGVSVAVAADG
jgi:hypothetical protein